MGELVRFWMRHGMNAVKPTSISTAVEVYISARQAEVTAKRLRNVRSHLGSFSAKFAGQNVHDIGADDLRTWVASLDVSNVTKNDVVKNVAAFYVWAAKRHMAPAGFNPASSDQLDRFTVVETEISILTPVQLEELLSKCPADLLPAAVLQALCGLRVSECERLTFERLTAALPSGWLRLAAKQTKTKKARVVPVCDAAKAFLAPYVGRTGWVVPREVVDDVAGQIKERTGLDYGKNTLRHSYCSYRYAVCQNVGQVAREAGHTVDVSEKHYSRADLTPEQGAAWFAILPEAPANIVTL